MAVLRAVALIAWFAAASAFSPAAPAHATRRSAAAAPVMSEGAASRRAVVASLVLGLPAAANAMIVPGLNGPGLVPAKKVAKSPQPEFDSIRDAGSNHFWSPKGIMNSVPKMKGIITPKSAIPGGL